ncbi:KUP/HAK/KT family potassium transporter [Coxiella burnetii]|uniref:KUP/HAK/KT family potassium transporter n=1 Tax=Coxiella burnetii TaxID=777 RepID=UPI003EBC0690
MVVTGGEALYADLGHFGKNPIRTTWFFIALPGLLLNYFGQAAYLLSHPAAIANPFYLIAARWFSIPLLIIATFATIIASQAMISAIFSLTRQAVLLGLYPRLPIIQTSEARMGQIYVPQMNFILAIGMITIILIFQSSSAIAHAYGVRFVFLAYKRWRWPVSLIFLIFSVFLVLMFYFWVRIFRKSQRAAGFPLLLPFFVPLLCILGTKG